MFVFLHIPKAAGTSFRFILENTFGVRHCHAPHCRSKRFEERDLARAMRFFPGLKSLAGHNLVDPMRLPIPDPFYMTMLRDPVVRVVSKYQDSVLRGGNTRPFEQTVLESEWYRNYQVRKIAGEEDLEKAKRLIERYHFVGLTERFDLSLHLLGRLTPEPLNLNYRKYVIPKNDRVKNEVLADSAKLDFAREHNALDIELHRYVVEEVFPERCRRVGLEPDANVPTFNTYTHDFRWRYRTGRLWNKVYRAAHTRVPGRRSPAPAS